MFDIVRRLASWAHRTPEIVRPHLLGLDPSPGPGFPADPATDEMLRIRLAAMPVMVREIYLLRMVDRMPINQIARRLAIPRGSVTRYLRSAIRILRAGASG